VVLKIALAQFKPTLNRENLQRHIEIIENLQQDVDLIIFPELSLNGYYLQDKVLEDCWDISELQEIAKLSQKVDIVLGGAIRENRDIFNSSLYFSDGELIHSHHKLHLPNYGLFEEARFFSDGEEIKAFKTRFGKTISLVCEDLWRGSTFAEIEKNQPDLIIVISSSPARGFENGEIEIVEQWKALLKSASILGEAKTIFVNRVGFEDGLGFWGGSMILNKRGKVEKMLPLYRETVEIFDI
jgi:predicted amidohydrolase